MSLPLAQTSHSHRHVLPYLWNLLPEGLAVLRRWGQQFKVSPSDPFKLLAHVGADIPGAALLVPPERVEEILAAPALSVDWLSEAELARRLRQLRLDAAAMRLPRDRGRMTLPGAQAKTALYHDAARKRWGVPAGRTPTTHIIKPCVPGFAGLVENEHFCQGLAARLQLAAARTSVLELDETYLVAERYDRLPAGPGQQAVRRIHQEDLCQALGLMPQHKYQQDGGPYMAQIMSLLRKIRVPEADLDRFLQANIFNWLIGGTDAHAKNYSLLISAGNQVRLAPLYDLSSALTYPERVSRRAAMKIGEHDDIARIDADDWRKLARACKLEEGRVLAAVEAMARALPDHISAARAKAIADGLSPAVINGLAAQLTAHERACLAKIANPGRVRPPRKSRPHRSPGP